MFAHPFLPGRPVRGVRIPSAFALLHPLPVGPAEEGKVEVAPRGPADVRHRGAASPLSRLHLVGDEQDAGDQRHLGGPGRMVAHGRKHAIALVLVERRRFAVRAERQHAGEPRRHPAADVGRQGAGVDVACHVEGGGDGWKDAVELVGGHILNLSVQRAR